MVNNAVVISDLHVGCKLGLCPESGVAVDEGGTYLPSEVQKVIWQWWQEWWAIWVPKFCRGESWVLVVNGDCIDGVHHNSVTQWSHNLEDQAHAAEDILRAIIKQKKCVGYYHIRGTEAHAGKSGMQEEGIARVLGAVPNRQGQYARYHLRLRIGYGLVDIGHHIGTTGSLAYETSALQKELEQIYVDAARFGVEIPDAVVRSHRHRNAETRVRIAKHGRRGFATSCVTAGWQLRTPFAHRTPGGRTTRPQIGGTVVRCGDEEVYTRHQVWDIEDDPIEEPADNRESMATGS